MNARKQAIRFSSVFLGLAVMLTIGATTAFSADKLTDTEISNAIDDRIMNDSAVPASYIDLSTVEGIVTLTGSVNNILAKDRAQKIASTVRGVRGIVNQIEVDAPFRSDTEIAEDVNDAFLWDPVTEAGEITTTVKNSVVTLSGTVDSWQEKELASKVAKGVRGVEGLKNELAVNYKAVRPDMEIKDEVEETLRWDAYVDDALIEVSVDDGHITLEGTVGSVAEKERAYNKAWVAGAKSVDNGGLDVKWWGRDERLRKDKYADKSDEDIEDAINDAFLYDPRVVSFEIDVESDEGYVTLRGNVDNLKAKRAAAQDARSVVGVWSVTNNIKVRPGTPSDNQIEENVQEALIRDPYVERFEIDVSVVDGEVYLYGDVDSTFEKSRADDVASRQIGVIDVHNFMTVNGLDPAVYNPYIDDWYLYDYDWYVPTEKTTTKSDWQIAADIASELFWSPFVDRDEVSIEVTDGVAHLTGTVDTWAERNAATDNALEGGATGVDNDLLVDYGPEG
jgi:osmotically-inducible protein OsmY